MVLNAMDIDALLSKELKMRKRGLQDKASGMPKSDCWLAPQYPSSLSSSVVWVIWTVKRHYFPAPVRAGRSIYCKPGGFYRAYKKPLWWLSQKVQHVAFSPFSKCLPAWGCDGSHLGLGADLEDAETRRYWIPTQPAFEFPSFMRELFLYLFKPGVAFCFLLSAFKRNSNWTRKAEKDESRMMKRRKPSLR